MLAVTGRRSTIVTTLEHLEPNEQVLRIDLDLTRPDVDLSQLPLVERYVLAAGVLYQRPILEQSATQMIESITVNALNVIRICEWLLQQHDQARICVIGSESARRGSFDATYAAGKAAVHAYVMAKRTRPNQQLVCVSPTIIADSGMTERRKDYPSVLEQREHVFAIDVARIIQRVLYRHPPDYLTGCIVPVTDKRTANGQDKRTH